MRKKQKFSHTLSRKGFARLENEMKEKHPNPDEITRVDLWEKGYRKKDGAPVNEVAADIMEQIKKCKEAKDNPPSNDSIRDDALARVLGPEPRGRVRGLGFGVTPSKVEATIQGNARVKELEAIVRSYGDRMGIFKAQLQAVMKGQQQNPNKNLKDVISSHVATPQSEQGSHHIHGQPIEYENAKCQLLNWENFEAEEVVAEGRIASVDPRTKVHHMTLGRDCWKVWVDTVFYEDLKLYRPTDEFYKLAETLGSTIAWPKSSIKLL